MNPHDHSDAYRDAADAAMSELDLILQESAQLRNRMDQLQAAVVGLKPLMDADAEALLSQRRPISESMGLVAESAHEDQFNLSQHVGVAIPQLVPQRPLESTDPIQRRIDSMLGLAVA
jgi:hypothetical protein